MSEAGLEWLADSPLAATPASFCLTLARGVTMEEMFAAFGADAAAAVPCHWQDLQEVMHVQVGRCGDWVFALEMNSGNGQRPQVLQKASVSGKAVSVRRGRGESYHQFAYAENGDLIGSVNTSFLGSWDGINPGQLKSLAREVGLILPKAVNAQNKFPAVLEMAGRISGCRLNSEDLKREWPAAELPALPLEEGEFCLSFVQGLDEGEIFSAFGADVRDVVPRRRRELENGISVQVGKVGNWCFALEMVSHEGIKTKIMRRISRPGKAVVVHYDPGTLYADFCYSENGELLARVNTSSPRRWQGSNYSRFQGWSQENWPEGDLSGPKGVRSVLGLAERICGVPIKAAAGDDLWPTSPILPLLKDAYDWDAEGHRILETGDTEIDQFVMAAEEGELPEILGARMNCLIRLSELDSCPEFVSAVMGVITGSNPSIGDHETAGRVLRKIAWEKREASVYRANIVRRGQPPCSYEDMERRKHLSGMGGILADVLAGKFREALSREIRQEKFWDPGGWRQRVLEDLRGDRDT